MKGKKGDGKHQPFKLPGNHVCVGEGCWPATIGVDARTMAACLFVCNCAIRRNNQQSDYRSLKVEGQGPLRPPWLLFVSCSGTTQLPAMC